MCDSVRNPSCRFVTSRKTWCNEMLLSAEMNNTGFKEAPCSFSLCGFVWRTEQKYQYHTLLEQGNSFKMCILVTTIICLNALETELHQNIF